MIIPHRRFQDNKLDRPRIRPEMGPADWILELLAVTLLVTFFAYLIYSYPKLPASIPSHFNTAGEADEFSERGTVWALPAIALFTYLLMTIISRFPHTFNFTVKITPQNALRQYTLAIRMIRFIKLVISGLFLTISLGIVRVAKGQSTGLGFWFMPVFLALVFVPIIIYFVMASRKN
jgi:uncharacterized membrane protein